MDILNPAIKFQCPNSSQLAMFKTAVAKGYITWHAGPMNLQPENGVEWLFRFGIQLSSDLDHEFNITRKLRVLSQRDVPGEWRPTYTSHHFSWSLIIHIFTFL